MSTATSSPSISTRQGRRRWSTPSSSAFEGHCDLLQFAWLFRQFRRNFSSGSARFLQFFWLSGENKTCTLIGRQGVLHLFDEGDVHAFVHRLRSRSVPVNLLASGAYADDACRCKG